MEKHKSLRCVLIIMGLFLTGACLAQTAQEPQDDCTREKLVSHFIAKIKSWRFTESDAEAIAEDCGIDALPALTDILNDGQTPPLARGFAAMCIGKTGQPESAKTIIQFIEKPRSEPIVSTDEFVSFQLAMYGLAYIGTDECIAFLKTLCSEDYWLNRDDRAMFYPDEALDSSDKYRPHINNWCRAAVAGLGALDPPKALEELNALRGTPTVAGIENSVEGCTTSVQKELESQL